MVSNNRNGTEDKLIFDYDSLEISNQVNNNVKILENIVKLFRVDFVWGYEEGKQSLMGLRIGIPVGLVGGNPND